MDPMNLMVSDLATKVQQICWQQQQKLHQSLKQLKGKES